MRIYKFLIATVLISCLAAAADPAAPSSTNLLVEDRVQPIDVNDPQPEFSWEMVSKRHGASQSAYQIQVATSCEKLSAGAPDLWDSGKINSSRNVSVSYGGPSLISRQAAFWRVRLWDNSDAAGPDSPCSPFQMGLLRDSDWIGKWIWSSEKREVDYSYFRKTFDLPPGTIRNARLYLSATHEGILHVNGHRSGRSQPFFHGDAPLYTTLALENLLKPGGKNVIGVLARWHGAGQGRPQLQPGVIAYLAVSYDDGREVTLGSDASWKSMPGEWYLLHNEEGAPKRYINDEGITAENIDRRRFPVGWDSPAYDDSAWKSAVETGQHPTGAWTGPLRSSEVRIVEHNLAPVDVWSTKPGSFTADFGKVRAASPEIQFEHIPPGLKIQISEGYRLDQERRVIPYAQKTDMRFEYITRGANDLFRTFWYLGFRYLQVDDLPPGAAQPQLRMIARHAEMPAKSASFISSNATLNEIWKLGAHSALFSAQEQIVDTPTREQGQFIYDAYLISQALSWLYNERDLTQQALEGFASSQSVYPSLPGKLDAVYPNGGTVQDIGDWTLVWLPWIADYYLESGDIETIKMLYPAAERTAAWIERNIDSSTGLFASGEPGSSAAGLVDWPDRYEYDTTVKFSTIMSLNAYSSLTAFAAISEAAGNTKAKIRAGNAAAKLRAAVNNRLWHGPSNGYSDGVRADGSLSPVCSQQTNAAAIALKIVPEEKRSAVLGLVKKKGFQSSIIMTRFLVAAYGESGDQAALEDFLLNEQGRNYAAILKDGATFTWENWLGRHKQTESSESHGMGSYGALLALRRYVAGITPVEPAYRRVRIKPLLMGLDDLSVSFPTPQGQLSVHYRRSAGRIATTIDIPANMVVDLELTGASHPNLGSGHHEFQLP